MNTTNQKKSNTEELTNVELTGQYNVTVVDIFVQIMNFLIAYVLGVKPTKNTSNVINFTEEMTDRMYQQIKSFINLNQENKRFQPINNEMPYIFKTDW